MHLVLETDRLMLRQFTYSDLDILEELDSDPEVMRYLNGGHPTPRAVLRDRILPSILGEYRKFPGLGRWAIYEKREFTFVGWVSLRPNGSGHEVELGYRLRRAAWDRGYATEIVRALVDHAFNKLGVRRIFAETMRINARSRSVLEKSGLRYVRTFHLDWDQPIRGGDQGEAEYEICRPDWVQALARSQRGNHKRAAQRRRIVRRRHARLPQGPTAEHI